MSDQSLRITFEGFNAAGLPEVPLTLPYEVAKDLRKGQPLIINGKFHGVIVSLTPPAAVGVPVKVVVRLD